MSIKETVLNILEEICESDIVKEDLNIDLFNEGLLDSFGTVSLLVEIEERLGIAVGISDFVREEWNTPNAIIGQLEKR
ncbi:D-alanine--poly(phosphoribitol) ligase subunit DltC [Neobacillus drentensis]|jgi:D-alanine--poly(phosphoribitol) ligase subunit 2|uniref:D-alanine--poly(phosphoribitol) ligase subunit DltC n=1 Tax=Neobacillus drentensis TaxID=220684 RepID=UPI00285C7872|nr:D-alanine--poly(phosphoribitol) ligase subunit DltC [Neobacillus drentensis]MDR7235830.1 D-alanine--poly(phosphoribitol) ligase subunit 2 [Neobacillus drentensis]